MEEKPDIKAVQEVTEPAASEEVQEHAPGEVEATTEHPGADGNPAEKRYTQDDLTKAIQKRVKNYKSEIAGLKEQITALSDGEQDVPDNEGNAEVDELNRKLTTFERAEALRKIEEKTGISGEVLQTVRGHNIDELKLNLATVKKEVERALREQGYVMISPMESITKKQGSTPKEDLGARLVNFLNDSE
jgi:hypothetical protein